MSDTPSPGTTDAMALFYKAQGMKRRISQKVARANKIGQEFGYPWLDKRQHPEWLLADQMEQQAVELCK